MYKLDLISVKDDLRDCSQLQHDLNSMENQNYNPENDMTLGENQNKAFDISVKDLKKINGSSIVRYKIIYKAHIDLQNENTSIRSNSFMTNYKLGSIEHCILGIS